MEIKTEFSIAEQLACIQEEIQIRTQMLGAFPDEPGKTIAINDLNCFKAIRTTLGIERALELAAEIESADDNADVEEIDEIICRNWNDDI